VVSCSVWQIRASARESTTGFALQLPSVPIYREALQSLGHRSCSRCFCATTLAACGCTGTMKLELYQKIVARRPGPDLRELDSQRVNFCES
jgi:hypothetical protein